MTRVSVRGGIAAPPAAVFQVVTDVDRLAETNPDVLDITYLTNQRRGSGTRFRERRRMKGREIVTELEVTEFIENERSRMVAESHGTTWDTLYTLTPVAGGTELEITLEARATSLVPRLLNPLMKGLFRRGMQAHLDQVRQYCERRRDGLTT